MTIAPAEKLSPPLTYEKYLVEGEINRRYDIINGRREFMPGPTPGHQRISKNLTRSMLQFERAFGQGQMYYAPMDVLIRDFPLQTRQPDLLFIGHERLLRAGVTDSTVVLTAAPELVVEILSASDRDNILADKLADYASIGVLGCWIVRQENETVEVRSLDSSQLRPIALYVQGQQVQSVTFPDLRIAVADVFGK